MAVTSRSVLGPGPLLSLGLTWLLAAAAAAAAAASKPGPGSCSGSFLCLTSSGTKTAGSIPAQGWTSGEVHPSPLLPGGRPVVRAAGSKTAVSDAAGTVLSEEGTLACVSSPRDSFPKTASVPGGEPERSTDADNGSSLCVSLEEKASSKDEGMSKENVVVITLLTIFSITGCVGNAVAFYIYNQRRAKNASVIFILALAGTDFITCLIIIPSVVVMEVLRRRVTVSAGCSVFMFLKTSNIPFSAYVMVAIAADRYLCICHPLVRILNVRRAKIIVACLALLAFTFGILTGINFGIVPSPPTSTTTTSGTAATANASRLDSSSGCLPCFSNCTGKSPVEVQAGLPECKSLELRCCPGMNTSSTRVGSSSPTEDADSLKCQPNGPFSENALVIFAKVYASSFLVCFCLVVTLYAMTYRSILSHRAKRAKRRQNSARRRLSRREQGGQDGEEGDGGQGGLPNRRPSEEHHANLYANVKTAAMLFVVALVFIVAYLPAWMMAESIGLLPYNAIAYNMYFVYNAANPFIYAFMNKSFRRDLRKILQVCQRR